MARTQSPHFKPMLDYLRVFATESAGKSSTEIASTLGVSRATIDKLVNQPEVGRAQFPYWPTTYYYRGTSDNLISIPLTFSQLYNELDLENGFIQAIKDQPFWHQLKEVSEAIDSDTFVPAEKGIAAVEAYLTQIRVVEAIVVKIYNAGKGLTD